MIIQKLEIPDMHCLMLKLAILCGDVKTATQILKSQGISDKESVKAVLNKLFKQ